MVLWMLAACHGGGGHGDGDAPTWNENVSPIVERSCVGCHHPGGVGPVDFTTYASAAPLATMMASYVEDGLMPPPAMDPTCRDYVGSERMTLTDDERQILADWADGGAPEGDTSGTLTWTDHTLADADVEVRLPVAHSVNPSDDGNEYHCQVLDNPFTEPTYITGFDVLVDQPNVVHHTVLAIDTSGDAGVWTGEDLSDGWDCHAKIAESDWNMLHAWAPGMEPTVFEDGLGLLINPGDQLVLQMHYFGGTDDIGTVDQSGYRFTTAASVDTEIHMAPVGPTGFTLPAGEVTTVDGELRNDYPVNVTVYGVFPHMHLLATGYEAVIESDSGTECLARSDAWDFGHQATYVYDEPATFSQGETLVGGCRYDNTADNPNQMNDPVEDVTFGEGTDEEMCFFLFYFSY